MATSAASIWDWSLAILPFTALITFIVMLIGCNLVSNYVPGGGNLLQISHIGSGNAYVYFLAGILMLVPQVLAIIIGRFQFLLQTQTLINKIVLSIIHIVCLIPLIFMLIVFLVGRSHRFEGNVLLTYGILGSIALYCFLHTIIVFYLYIRRATGSQYAKIPLPIHFLISCLLFITFFILWLNTNSVIAGYLAAAIPFIYFLGFVPQFWAKARSRKRYSAVSKVNKIIDSVKK